MRKFEIYFVDCNKYGGTMTVKCKDIYEARKALAQYIKVWDLEPITDLDIKEIKGGE